VGQKALARVSSTPGKTITINFYNLDEAIYLVDLPGYGYAKRCGASKSVFGNLTDSYFIKNPVRDLLKLVIQLIDVRVGPTDDDIMMINYLIDSGIPFTVVATKTDKLSKTALQKRLEELHHEYFEGTDIEILPFSSVTKAGREELWSVIFRAAEGE
jgi:GTP-binding protein